MRLFDEVRYHVKRLLYLFSFFFGMVSVCFFSIPFIFDVTPSVNETDLIKITGDIESIGKTSALDSPQDSVQIKLKGDQQLYRYPVIWKDAKQVFNISKASNVDIWVDARQQGMKDPLFIYQIVERNPLLKGSEIQHNNYKDVLAHQNKITNSHLKVGGWLLGFSILFGILRYLARRWPGSSRKTEKAVLDFAYNVCPSKTKDTTHYHQN